VGGSSRRSVGGLCLCGVAGFDEVYVQQIGADQDTFFTA
jgi:hypothetical protein